MERINSTTFAMQDFGHKTPKQGTKEFHFYPFCVVRNPWYIFLQSSINVWIP